MKDMKGGLSGEKHAGISATSGDGVQWTLERHTKAYSGKVLWDNGQTSVQEARNLFLYYALHQPHVPRVPHPRFVGKSGMGPRGDCIVEADWCVGELYFYAGRKRVASKYIDYFIG